MTPSLRASFVFFVFASCVFALAYVRADRSSGTWTGAVEARSNYYWERSTRVVAPVVHAEIDTPGGVRIQGEYLLDLITSASVGAGLISDVRFTERRHDGSLGFGYEWDLGEAKLLTTLGGRLSVEPDYTSYSGNFAAQLSLNDRATVLSFSTNIMHDDVGRVLRGSDRSMGGRNLSNRGKVGTLDHFFFSVGWTQLITPRLLFELGYDLGYLNGFQANPYRMVPVGGVSMAERHPDERVRHTVYGRLAYFFPSSRTAVHLLYRAYVDSWDIAALTPELRVFQEIGDFATLRMRYRLYTQSKASFQRNPADYVLGETLYTADPKMTAFHSHLLGGQVMLRLDFLDGSPLEFASKSTIDISFDYLWNTNRFGNGVIAQMGLRVPF